MGAPRVTLPEVCSHPRLSAGARLGSGGNFPGLIKINQPTTVVTFLCVCVLVVCLNISPSPGLFSRPHAIFLHKSSAITRLWTSWSLPPSCLLPRPWCSFCIKKPEAFAAPGLGGDRSRCFIQKHLQNTPRSFRITRMSRACKSCCRRERGNLPSSQLHKHSSKALPNPGWPPAAGIRGCGVTATGQHQPLLWAELWGEQSAQILMLGVLYSQLLGSAC